MLTEVGRCCCGSSSRYGLRFSARWVTFDVVVNRDTLKESTKKTRVQKIGKEALDELPARQQRFQAESERKIDVAENRI